MRVQSDVEARRWFGGARAGNATLQIVVELLGDQPFLEQRLISHHLLPQGRLTEKTDFQGRHIIGILAPQRVEGVAYPFPSPLDNLARDLGDALAKDRAQPAVVEAGEPVD